MTYDEWERRLEEHKRRADENDAAESSLLADLDAHRRECEERIRQDEHK